MPVEDAPRVNRAAVQLATIGGLGVIAYASLAIRVGPPIFADALIYVVIPIVLVIVSIPLAVGSRRTISVVGASIPARILFILWAVSTAVSQLMLLGEFSDSRSVSLEVEMVRQVVSVVAAASGILAGVLIMNTGPRTLLRGALILGVALYAISEALLYAGGPAIGAWWGIPLSLGQLLIGLSYLRVGLKDAAPVPEAPESLAE